MRVNHLRLKQADDGLGERVVIGIAAAARRGRCRRPRADRCSASRDTAAEGSLDHVSFSEPRAGVGLVGEGANRAANAGRAYGDDMGCRPIADIRGNDRDGPLEMIRHQFNETRQLIGFLVGRVELNRVDVDQDSVACREVSIGHGPNGAPTRLNTLRDRDHP